MAVTVTNVTSGIIADRGGSGGGNAIYSENESLQYIIDQMTANKAWFSDTLYNLACRLKDAQEKSLRNIDYLNLLYAKKTTYNNTKNNISALKNLNGDKTQFSIKLEEEELKKSNLTQNLENEIQNAKNKIQEGRTKIKETLIAMEKEFEKYYMEQDDKEKKPIYQKWNDPKWCVFKAIKVKLSYLLKTSNFNPKIQPEA